MFVAPPHRPVADTPAPEAPRPARRLDRPRDLAALALLAERTRPVSSSQARVLPVAPPLDALLPDGGLRRGTTVVVGTGDGDAGRATDGRVSVALALLAAASGPDRGAPWSDWTAWGRWPRTSSASTWPDWP